MAESFTVSGTTRKERYESVIQQVKSLVEGENDTVAGLSNIAAALKHGMGFFWVGFYRVINNELVLGPFQGPVACTRIAWGKGVCGTAWKEKKIIRVDNVDEFPGHIACSSESKSEIVLPVLDTKGNVCMVLDVDSDTLADFDDTDKRYLQEIVVVIENLFTKQE